MYILIQINIEVMHFDFRGPLNRSSEKGLPRLDLIDMVIEKADS